VSAVRGPLALALLLLAAAPARAEEKVTIDNFTFSPEEITVRRGEEVRWVNQDDIPHVVAGSDGAFTSPPLDTGDDFARTFAEPGRYEYFCAIHPHMKGTIVVR
jgi:plastocyanin